MKNFILLLIAVALAGTLNAQQNGLPNFMNKTKQALDPGALAGIYTYETSGVLDQIKVRRSSRRAAAGAVIDDYNRSVNRLREDNLSSLVGLGVDIKNVVFEKRWADLLTARSDYRDRNESLQGTQMELHRSMESELNDLLTRRQRRKWSQFQERHQEALNNRVDASDLLTFLGVQ